MWVDNGCDSCAKGDENCGPTNGCKCHYPGGCDSPNWQSTFQDFYNLHQSPNVWTKFARTDFWDCDSVDRNIDEQQCTWDSSWIPQFRQDVKETKFYSITVWIKPTDNSFGMPRFFKPFIRLMSRLSRPFSLLQVGERSPELEDQIDFIDWRMGRSLQRATAMHDFKDWTMLFFSHEFDGTSWTKCITVNAISMTCALALLRHVTWE